jgi:ankyrin repeat protein
LAVSLLLSIKNKFNTAFLVDKDIQDKINGSTALISSIKGSYIDISLLLIRAGANLNIHDYNGGSALIYASKKGLLSVVNEMLKRKVLLTGTDDEGKNSLIYAVMNRDIHMVDTLLKGDINPHIKDELTGKSALHYSCEYGNISMIKSLLNHSINTIDKFDKNGNTALIYAIKHGNPEVISILIKDGFASVNVCNKKTGESPLIIAIYLNLIDIIKLLIQAGVNINYTGVKTGGVYPIGSRVTPLCLAVMNNNFEVVHILMKNGCNMTIKCDVDTIKNNNYNNSNNNNNNHINHIHKNINSSRNNMYAKSDNTMISDVSKFMSPSEIAGQNKYDLIIKLFENTTRRR